MQLLLQQEFQAFMVYLDNEMMSFFYGLLFISNAVTAYCSLPSYTEYCNPILEV